MNSTSHFNCCFKSQTKLPFLPEYFFQNCYAYQKIASKLCLPSMGTFESSSLSKIAYWVKVGLYVYQMWLLVALTTKYFIRSMNSNKTLCNISKRSI